MMIDALCVSEAEFVALMHSHLCDTASRAKQHYGELKRDRNTLAHKDLSH